MLTFILIVQDDASPAAKYMIDYLLQEFPPLADHFNAQHRQPLIGTEDVMRVPLQVARRMQSEKSGLPEPSDDDDQPWLLIREEFRTKLLADAIEIVREADAE